MLLRLGYHHDYQKLDGIIAMRRVWNSLQPHMLGVLYIYTHQVLTGIALFDPHEASDVYLRSDAVRFFTRHAHPLEQGGKRAGAQVFCYIDVFRGRSTLTRRQKASWPAKRTFHIQAWSTSPFIRQ